MLIPAGVKVHLAFGYTDLRKGIDGLGVLVERVLKQDPFSGHLFVFRGKRAKRVPGRHGHIFIVQPVNSALARCIWRSAEILKAGQILTSAFPCRCHQRHLAGTIALESSPSRSAAPG